MEEQLTKAQIKEKKKQERIKKKEEKKAKKKGIFKEFGAFVKRGNVIDLAVGIIIGGAFGAIVSSLVADIVTPLISLVLGVANFKDLMWVIKPAEYEVVGGVKEIVKPAVTLTYGNFIQTILDFLIIAFSIFVAVKSIVYIKSKMDKAQEKLAKKIKAREERLVLEAKRKGMTAEEIALEEQKIAETARKLEEVKKEAEAKKEPNVDEKMLDVLAQIKALLEVNNNVVKTPPNK